MATEPVPRHQPTYDERPSERTVPIPPLGSDDAALLANLNEVYGEPDPDDERVLAGVRQAMRGVLEHER